MSFGYLVHDFIDLVVNERSARIIELLFHHVVVLTGFTVTHITGQFLYIVVIGLLMEVNRLFKKVCKSCKILFSVFFYTPAHWWISTDRKRIRLHLKLVFLYSYLNHESFLFSCHAQHFYFCPLSSCRERSINRYTICIISRKNPVPLTLIYWRLAFLPLCKWLGSMASASD